MKNELMTKEICFDMDGTLNNFFEVDGWLDDLIAHNPRPYKVASPSVNMNALARHLNRLKKNGYTIKIISWSSKARDAEFDKVVREAKIWWLNKHMPSFKFDEINVLPYGTPKEEYGHGILFDDEPQNRENWRGVAYDETNILGILRSLR